MKSFFPYFGAKSALAPAIIARIPDHVGYVEVFGGSGKVLFAKPEGISKSEIFNDISRELTTLYRCVQHHLDEFVRYLRWLLVSRAEFDRLKAESPETLTDIQRAVRYFFLLRNAYGGRIASPTFAISPTKRPSINLLRIEEELSEIHLRLARVYIENRTWEQVLERHDRPGTFFYLDPPYHGYETQYGKGIFSEEDFLRMSDMLAALKGRFLLSINDTPEVRSWFGRFTIEEVRVRYNLGEARAGTELLIRNY